MQKSDRNEEKHKNRAEHSIAIPACPRCGNGKTRISSTKESDGLLNSLFRKSYRCQICRHRFWVMNPLRLVLIAGILLVLVPVFGVVWIVFNKQPAVANSAQIESHDQIKSLAEKGDAEAELQMGLRYSSSAWGVKDDKIAAQWFEKAARHDRVEAQYRYGLALLEGQGVVQDYKAALYWLEKAARQGHAEARFALGDMYHSGIGIKSDLERAYLWFNLAAAQGVDKAASPRDHVVQLLTPNQIAAMQEEASRIVRSQHSGPVASMPKVESKEPVPGVIDKPSAKRSISVYRYSGRTTRRKKVESKENVPGFVDNQYSERTTRRKKVELKEHAPQAGDNPSAYRSMPGVNRPMPGVNRLIPGVNSPIPGVNSPTPGVKRPMPWVKKRPAAKY
jgi:uncharacterized protein